MKEKKTKVATSAKKAGNNKFINNLVKDAHGIKQQRAEILAEETKYEQEEIVRNLAKEKRALETKLVAMTDLSPDNTYSLRPGGDGFNPKQWVREMQNVKVALLNKEVELQLAEETLEEWFGDAEEENVTE